ncbi:hypothetical protein [Methylobacterium sp. Leaf86]|uniref:hypothetical protein n=1 Tax=Methylobacterium sp. Leaf86 TaxID=1736242 RepID=UPI00138EF58E|nr:hypothetical protein [Methylobacterium sp. Leaf86]
MMETRERVLSYSDIDSIEELRDRVDEEVDPNAYECVSANSWAAAERKREWQPLVDPELVWICGLGLRNGGDGSPLH